MTLHQKLLNTIDESKRYFNDKNVINLIEKEKSISEIGTVSTINGFKLYIKFDESNPDLIERLINEGLELSTGEYIDVQIISNIPFRGMKSMDGNQHLFNNENIDWMNNEYDKLNLNEKEEGNKFSQGMPFGSSMSEEEYEYKMKYDPMFARAFGKKD